MAEIERVTEWRPAQVAELLLQRGFEPTGEVIHIGSGHWSDCFAFEQADRDLVIRIGGHVADFRKDQIASRFAGPELPIPSVFDVGTCGSEFFAVSERVFGEPLEQVADWPQIVPGLAGLLESLRTVDITSMTGWGQWTSQGTAPASSWREFLLQIDQDPPSHRTHGWRERLDAMPDAARQFGRCYALLESSIVDDVPRSLVHNDLFNRNAYAIHGRISGVFDWGNSLLGDHLYDLSLLCFWSPWFEHIDEHLLIRELQRRWGAGDVVPNFGPRLLACLLHAGLEHLGYHAALFNESEVNRVANRLNQVIDYRW